MSVGASDLFVVKYSSAGSVVWANRPAGSGGFEYAQGVGLWNDTNLFLTGGFVGTITFGTTQLTSVNGSAVFTTKAAVEPNDAVARITSIRLNSGMVVLSWEGGLSPFQLQMRTNLTTGAWQNAGGSTINRGATNSFSPPATFYRVQSQ